MGKLDKLRQISNETPSPSETEAMYIKHNKDEELNNVETSVLDNDAHSDNLILDITSSSGALIQDSIHVESIENTNLVATNLNSTNVESSNSSNLAADTLNKENSLLTTFRVQKKCMTYIAYKAKQNGITRQQYFDMFFREIMINELANPSEIRFEDIVPAPKHLKEDMTPMGMLVENTLLEFIKKEADKNIISYSAYVDREITKAINNM